MIFLLFVAAVVVLELVLRLESKRRESERPILEEPAKPSPARNREDPSVEGLLALRRALDLYGKGERPVESSIPVVHTRVSDRESSD